MCFASCPTKRQPGRVQRLGVNRAMFFFLTRECVGISTLKNAAHAENPMFSLTPLFRARVFPQTLANVVVLKHFQVLVEGFKVIPPNERWKSRKRHG